MEEKSALEALIQRCVNGEEESLRELTRAISAPLLPYLLSRTPRREDALDALQDTLVDVWQSLPRFTYRSDAAFFKFVFTIGRRKLSRTRAMRIHEEALPDTHDVADMDAPSSPEERIVVSRALTGLSERDREIVMLRYWSGLPFSTIASILSMTEGAVRVRHHRALRDLEGTLTPYVT